MRHENRAIFVIEGFNFQRAYIVVELSRRNRSISSMSGG
jgi:hypothetical protein